MLIGLRVYAGSCFGVADCRAIRPGLAQAALSKKKTHRFLDPKAHARADYHTFGAAGEKTVVDQMRQLSARRPEHARIAFLLKNYRTGQPHMIPTSLRYINLGKIKCLEKSQV